MEIVIKLDDETYKEVMDRTEFDTLSLGIKLIEAVQNGTPLKRHGRVGDLDALEKEMQSYLDDCAKTSKYTRLGFETAIAVVEDADTIIEAYKGE